MITLDPPYYQYKGMLILRDHLDAHTYYYLPNHPHFSTLTQEIRGDDGEVVETIQRPAVRFIKYRHDLDDFDPDANRPTGGGFLFCDVDLGYDPDFIKKAAADVAVQANLERVPTLVPPPWESGTVQFMVLGQKSAVPDADDTSGDDEPPPLDRTWVTAFAAPGVPSLYGDNRAIFQVALPREAATLLEASFAEGTIAPIGVVYNLRFLAMRPAYRITIEVDWEMLYHFFSERWSVDQIFFEIDIQNALEELEESGQIKFHTEVGDPDAAEQAEAAREELKSLVIEKWFEPKLSPTSDGADDTASDVIGVMRDLVHLGAPTIGYSRKDITVHEQRSFDAEMSMARAVERFIAPQAHLSLMFRKAGLPKEAIVGEPIDLDDPFFETFDLEVLTTGGWADDGVELITASVQYGDASTREDYGFEAEDRREIYKANYDPAIGYDYRYQWSVIFKNDAPPGPSRLDVPETVRRGGPLVLNPRELFKRRQVRIVPLKTLSFEDYPAVEVDLRYDGPEAFSQSHKEVLGEAREAQPWTLRLKPDWPDEVSYLITLHRPGRPPIVRDWVSTNQGVITIDDPHAQGLKVWVRAVGAGAATIIVDLKYEDPDNDVFEMQNLVFDAGNMNQVAWFKPKVASVDRTAYLYRQVVFLAGGDVMETTWIETNAPGIIVGEASARQWPFTMKLTGPDFDAADLDHIEAALTYDDPDNGIHLEKTNRFLSVTDTLTWKLHLSDVNRRQVGYQLTYRKRNGMRLRRGPFETREPLVLVPTEVED